ncbi:MAG: twin-arginine translocase subunit TatC [Syntrophaceae bacterium]|nr:twin-arginine translocase subunit TatC [Syntrophaceae bacterium]
MTDPNEDKMPLTAHLEELRKRLVRSLIAVGVAFVACFFFKEDLFAIVARPLIRVLPPGSHLIYTGLPEAFFTYIKVSFYAGLFLASPVVLYQAWKFISPGLYPGERKFVAPFVATSTLLFVAGVCFGYFLVLPPAYSFFLEFSTDFLKPMLSMREYLTLTLKLLLAFGIIFEIPVFLFFMTKIGLVTPRKLARMRRYAIVVFFIVAALITPTPDAFTQSMMAIPMIILYEVGILVSKLAARRKDREDTETA